MAYTVDDLAKLLMFHDICSNAGFIDLLFTSVVIFIHAHAITYIL